MSLSHLSIYLSKVKELSRTLVSSGKTDIKEHARLQVVLGNTACDLDTAACTLALAIHLSIQKSVPTDPVWVLPVFNLSIDEMRIKTEVIYLLETMQIKPEDLIYRADIGHALNTANLRSQLEVTLVDHHYDEVLMNSVVEIIDHHTVQGELPGNVVTTIEPVGSCSTLVVQKINHFQESMSQVLKRFREVLDLCYGAILLDTVNFNPGSHRYTDLDKVVVSLIEARMGYKSETNLVRNRFYQNLLTARCNVTDLTALQLLYKDFKMVSALPICALTSLVQNYIKVTGAEQALQDFCEKNKTNELILVGIYILEGEITRDLGFYSVTENAIQIQQMGQYMLDLREPNFELTLIEDPAVAIPGLTIYKQGNVQLTRKHLIPVIRDAMLVIYPE